MKKLIVFLSLMLFFLDGKSTDTCSVYLQVREGQGFIQLNDSILPPGLIVDAVLVFPFIANISSAEILLTDLTTSSEYPFLIASSQIITAEETGHLRILAGPLPALSEFSLSLILKDLQGSIIKTYIQQ